MNIYEFAMGTSMFTQTLWWIAIPATIVFLISTAIMFFGGDTDVDTDVDIDIDTDMDDGPSFTVFSFSNMVTFLMMFSWVTLLLIKNGGNEIISIIWGFVAGVIMMILSILLHVAMKSLETNNTPTINTVIGKTGTIINRISSKGKFGKIQVIHNGGLKTYDCTADTKINMRSKVKVIDVVNNILFVEEI